MAGSHERVLVVAPHPDDEALGAGGVMATLTHGDHDVYVALMTSGDGFKEDAARYYLSLAVSPEEYLHLGYERQKESIEALARLGVAPDHVFFLGFPDGGLDACFLTYWDQDAFVSPTTGKSQVPYLTAWQPDVPYQGRAMLEVLLSLYQTVQPTRLVMPSAFDTHPDHWGTNAFATLAWAEMARQDGNWRAIERWGYLVHWPAWPMPLAYRPSLPEAPPERLLGLRQEPWHHEPLEPFAVEAKRHALMAYESQVELIKPFMLGFVRKTEAFAIESQWQPQGTGGHAVVENPVQDLLTRTIRKSNPLKGLTVGPGGAEIEWQAPPSAGVTVEMDVKMIDGQRQNHSWRVNAARVQARSKDTRWTITWPGDFVKRGVPLMIGAQAFLEQKNLGKIPFRVLPGGATDR